MPFINKDLDMSELKITTVNLTDEDTEWLDSIAHPLNMSRSRVLRRLIKTVREYSQTTMGKALLERALRRSD